MSDTVEEMGDGLEALNENESTSPNQDNPKQPSLRELRVQLKFLRSKLPWLNERLREGEMFLKKQPNYDMIDKAIQATMNQDEAGNYVLPPQMRNGRTSTAKTNRTRKVFETLVALMTDTKPFWNYSIQNRRFEQQATNYGKVATNWYKRTSFDLKMGEMQSWAGVAGSAVVYLHQDPECEDQRVRVIDPRNVLPIFPRGNNSIQEDTSGAIMRERVPIARIKHEWGVDVPSESSAVETSLWGKLTTMVNDAVGPIANLIRNQNEQEKTQPKLPQIPSAWLYHAWIDDYSENTEESLGREFTGGPLEIGRFYDTTETVDGNEVPVRKPANNWSYVVQVGERLFPNKRLIIWAGNRELYDGPNFYWHGQVPLIKYTPSPYPWSWFGYGWVWDAIPLQASLNKTIQVIENHIRQVGNPGAIADKNNVSAATLRNLNTAEAGWKVHQNPSMGKGVQIQNPPPLDASVINHRDWLTNEIDITANVVDTSQLMGLGQLPSNSSIEALMSAMTPVMRYRSRCLEAFVRTFAMQFAYNVTQFMTLPQLVAELGAGALTVDDFDFDAGSFVPDYIYNDEYTKDGNINAKAVANGPRPRMQRAKDFLRMFVFSIDPGSMLNSANMERTMMYFQLARIGFMDPITLMEQLNIPNIGVDALPDTVRTVLQRIAWCQQNGLIPNVNAAGRKASGEQPPQVQEGGGNIRMSESG